MPLSQNESGTDEPSQVEPQMRLSLALSVTTGSRDLAEGRLHRSRREVPRHGGRCPRFVTGSICVVGSVGSVHNLVVRSPRPFRPRTQRADPPSPPSIVASFWTHCRTGAKGLFPASSLGRSASLARSGQCSRTVVRCALPLGRRLASRPIAEPGLKDLGFKPPKPQRKSESCNDKPQDAQSP